MRSYQLFLFWNNLPIYKLISLQFIFVTIPQFILISLANPSLTFSSFWQCRLASLWQKIDFTNISLTTSPWYLMSDPPKNSVAVIPFLITFHQFWDIHWVPPYITSFTHFLKIHLWKWSCNDSNASQIICATSWRLNGGPYHMVELETDMYPLNFEVQCTWLTKKPIHILWTLKFNVLGLSAKKLKSCKNCGITAD